MSSDVCASAPTGSTVLALFSGLEAASSSTRPTFCQLCYTSMASITLTWTPQRVPCYSPSHGEASDHVKTPSQ